MNIATLARNIDRVTRHVCSRQGKRKPPSTVFPAALAARSELDPDALELVLHYLATCRYAPPARVGASAWDLGGPVLEFIRTHRESLPSRTSRVTY